MREDDIIKTPVCRNTAERSLLREKRINEALAFEGGTPEEQRWHTIATLPGGKQAYFLKPGREAQRQNPNVNDMLPCVGSATAAAETGNFTFEVIWEYLVKIALVDQILFKKILVLLYRICYFLDHQEVAGSGCVRYAPSQELVDYIDKIDTALKRKLKEDAAIGLLEYLHFIDLLGWNEDVKYHASGGASSILPFGDKSTGRTNTIVSVISVPLMVNDFLSDITKNIGNQKKINVRPILSTMQQLSKSRGICVLSGVQLREYLSPHLTEK